MGISGGLIRTVGELKDFIKDCNDNDLITMCSCCDDNPVSDCYDVGVVDKINVNNNNTAQICFMPK